MQLDGINRAQKYTIQVPFGLDYKFTLARNKHILVTQTCIMCA
jgi:hypothetical protein